MSILTVDVSPMAVNRTAMYFIVRDTVKALVAMGIKLRLVAMGETLPLPVFIANDYALPRIFEEDALRRLGELVRRGGQSAQRDPSVHADEVFLAFDPLYIFNAAETGRIICFALDLTPYTRPEWHAAHISRIYAAAFERLRDERVEIVAISQSTARDLWANFGIPRDRITCIPLYDRLGDSHVPRDPRRSFLFVGSLERRKNLVGLINGFELSDLANEGYSLHVVGGDGHGAAEIRGHAAGVKGVHLLGRLSDKDLEQEYSTCCALAYPSWWEGFGLPALEGLRRGIPLLLADTGALPEVAGPFATYVDPCNVHSIAAGLKEVAARQPLAGVPSSPEAASEQLALHTHARYLEVIKSLIEPYAEPWLPIADASSPQKSIPAPRQVNRLGRWLLLNRTRVLPASNGDVPPDSFSLDYLYGIQQERRAALSRSLAAVMTGGGLRLPLNLMRAFTEYVWLRITNTVVQGMINETVAMRLSATLGDKSG